MAKVVFLQNIAYDYIGTMMLSNSLKRTGHECRVLIGNRFSRFRKELLRDPPDIVAFSLMSGLHLWGKGDDGRASPAGAAAAAVRDLRRAAPDVLSGYSGNVGSRRHLHRRRRARRRRTGRLSRCRRRSAGDRKSVGEDAGRDRAQPA